MNERIEVELNQEEVQSIIDCYEKDIKYIKKLEKEKQELIDYLKESIKFEKSSSMWTSRKRLNAYEEILSKIEKR